MVERELNVYTVMSARLALSTNDASVVIAENVSGSVPAFAERMTRTARALGMSNTRFPIGRLPRDEVNAVVRTNLLGSMYGSKVALAGMREQGSGAIYNFEGFGSNGYKNRGMSLYGSTKFAITYFTKALIAETQGGPVRVGYMSPGIVITDLSIRDKGKMPPQAWAFVVKIYNILADRVETVTPWLVEKVLADTGHGSRIAWLTRGKSLRRFLGARFKPPGDRFPELLQTG